MEDCQCPSHYMPVSLCREQVEGMIRIKVKTDGDEETSEYVDIAPGSKIHITQAPLRPGIDYSERMYGAPNIVSRNGMAHAPMPVAKGMPGYAEHERLQTEHFFTWTPEVLQYPLSKAHVARTVEIKYGESGGTEIVSTVDEGHKHHQGHIHTHLRPPMAPAQPYMSPGFGPQAVSMMGSAPPMGMMGSAPPMGSAAPITMPSIQWR